MGPMTFLVAATLVGFQFGWEPRPEGGCQYIIEPQCRCPRRAAVGQADRERPAARAAGRSAFHPYRDGRRVAAAAARAAGPGGAAAQPSQQAPGRALGGLRGCRRPAGIRLSPWARARAKGTVPFSSDENWDSPQALPPPSRGCRSGLPWSPSSPPWAETSSSPGSLGMPATATAHSWDQPSLDRMVDILRQSRSLLMITGAGISAAEEEGGMKDESRVEARLRFRNRPSPVRPPPY